jgi:hypothetical protein
MCILWLHFGGPGAFRKMVAGEVKQLRSLLTQQAAPQLSSTIHLLDGPIAAAGASTSGPSAHAASKAGKTLGSPGADAASAFPALAAAGLAAAAGDAGGRASEAEDVEGCSDTGLPAGDDYPCYFGSSAWLCSRHSVHHLECVSLCP